MKILQINKYHYIKGGADRVYFNTGALLSENGHEVTYFSTSNPDNLDCRYSEFFVPYVENRNNGFGNNVLNSANYLYNRAVLKNLTKLIEKYRPDIAHLHLIYGELSGSVLHVLKKNRIPVVQTVHDYRMLCPANALLDSHDQICEKCRNRFYFQCSLKRCLEGNFYYSTILAVEAYTRKYFIDPLDYINRFIFVSKFSESKHIEFNKRFSSKSVHLYNFSEPQKIINISHKEGYYLFFGRLSKEKGLLTLLDVAENMNIKLRVAGTGPLESEVLRRAENNKNIQFAGYLSGESLNELIRGSDFIVVPSEWYENNPMTVIEAYANGIPVIGAKIGGIPEIVINDGTGFLFNSKDKTDLARVILKSQNLNPLDYDRLSENARKFAEQNFSSVSHYNKLMEIYNTVLQHA